MAEPHSAQFLTDERDHWWHPAQLGAIAARLDLASVRDAVDVGCGQGHWTRLVAGVLPGSASIVAIDREPRWIATARGDARIRYVTGVAEQLPLADHSVDLVTAQTLLVHVADPRAVLAEMHRVLRPGGTLWLVEPNNLASSIAMFAAPSLDPELATEALRLELVCERGKHALGLGYNSLGETLVGMLEPDAWCRIAVELCDRVHPIAPPYDDDLLAEVRAWIADPIFTWPRAETERYYVAGGGDPSTFARAWDAAITLLRRRADAILAGRYAAAEGALLYSITATRS